MRQDENLDSKQLIALEALLAGKSVVDAATDAKVTRRTLHRWRKEPTFEAAYNRERRDVWEAFQMRLLMLAERAVDNVENAIEDGDTRTSMTILKGLGLLPGKMVIGPDTPEGIEFEQLLGLSIL